MKNLFFKITVFFGGMILSMCISSLVYAVVWPTTPVGEYVRGGITSILEKSLQVTGSGTNGVVKKALDTNNLGSGTIVSVSGNIGVGTPTPSAKLDVIGKTKATTFQLTTTTASGYIAVSDASGDTNWMKNNYRKKVTSLLVNGGNYGFTCFVMEDTSLKCAGYNGNGNMGLGNNTNNYYYPQNIPLKGVKKVYSNNLNNYALMLNGDVYFIGGYNNRGEGGVGGTGLRYVPQKISGISDIVDFVTSGGYYTDGTTGYWTSQACALKIDGTVWCWGRNGTAQLGVGDETHRNTPTQVYGITNAKKVVMTDGQPRTSACALLTDNSVKCWGWSGRGILGNGDTNQRTFPTTVVISDVEDIVTAGSNQGGNHMCALLQDKTVKCWGYNAHGQLGVGDATHRYFPTTVSGLSNVKNIYITKGSAYSNYAVTYDGKVYAWGENGRGQIGDGTTTNRNVPVLISELSNVKKIVSAGRNATTTCALKNDGTIWCWGRNAYGQLGVGDTANRSQPTQVLGITSAIDFDIYVKYYDGTVFTCALLDDGSVDCWGWNGYGQLGQGMTNNILTPQPVKGLNID